MAAPKLTVEHLGLRAQPVTLLNQVVDLLTSLQHTLDGLVESDLGLKSLSDETYRGKDTRISMFIPHPTPSGSS